MEPEEKVEVYLETVFNTVYQNWEQAERAMIEAETKYQNIKASSDWQKIRRAFEDMKKAWADHSRDWKGNDNPELEAAMEMFFDIFFSFAKDGFKSIAPYLVDLEG